MTNFILVYNGKQIRFTANSSWSVAQLKDKIQSKLQLDTCKIVGLPKSESTTLLSSLTLKENLKLICIGQAISEEQKKNIKQNREKLEKEKEYQEFMTTFVEKKELHIRSIIGKIGEKVKEALKKNKSEFNLLNYYKLHYECAMGNASNAQTIFRNCFHQFKDKVNLQYGKLLIYTAFGNSLELFQYLLENIYEKPMDPKHLAITKNILFERQQRDTKRINELKAQNKIEEAEREQKNLMFRLIQERDFDESQTLKQRKRFKPLDLLKTEIPIELVKFGRLEILKYLKEKWFFEFFIPEWTILSTKDKFLYLDLPKIRQKQGDLPLENEEELALQIQYNKLIIHDPEFIWVITFRELFCNPWIFEFGMDYNCIFYMLNFLKDKKQLDSKVLSNLTINAIENSNHFIYLELLNHWDVHHEFLPLEKEFVNYLEQNPSESKRFLPRRGDHYDELIKNQLNTFKLTKEDAKIECKEITIDKNGNPHWNHWFNPEILLIINPKSIKHLDWLFERIPSLLNENCMTRFFNETHPKVIIHLIEKNPNIFTKDLLLSLFQSWFSPSESSKDMIRMLNLILFGFRNEYFVISHENFIQFHLDVQFFYMMSWALLEKKELMADHLAKFCCGRMDSMKEICQSIHKGEAEYKGNQFIEYSNANEMITFDRDFSRLIVFHIAGTHGLRYQKYIDNGKLMMGENWKKTFAELIEEKRLRKIQRIDEQKTEISIEIKEKLNEVKDAWNKMLMEQVIQNSNIHKETDEKIQDLQVKKKMNLLDLTCLKAIESIDVLNDVHFLMTLL